MGRNRGGTPLRDELKSGGNGDVDQNMTRSAGKDGWSKGVGGHCPLPVQGSPRKETVRSPGAARRKICQDPKGIKVN